MRLAAWAVLLVVGLASISACVPVKPWQREHLARPAMQARVGDTGMDDEYRAKVVESKTGGGIPGDAPGGGCGCTQ